MTDINGNVTNESFQVTIHDVDAPEIDNMPADITTTNDEGDLAHWSAGLSRWHGTTVK